jgi:hypothetical protein
MKLPSEQRSWRSVSAIVAFIEVGEKRPIDAFRAMARQPEAK